MVMDQWYGLPSRAAALVSIARGCQMVGHAIVGDGTLIGDVCLDISLVRTLDGGDRCVV